MNGNILFVLTNHSKLGSAPNLTGWYLPECAHPYKEITQGGKYRVDFASPNGGPCPVDKSSLSYLATDDVCKQFYNDKDIQARINSSIPASQLDLSRYVAIFYVGGHGPMWDVVHCKPLADKVAGWYLNNPRGVLGAVCHGPAGLVNVAIQGKPLVEGARMTCFSNAEEASMHLSNVVPFLLESRLKERGAVVQPGPNMQECVVVDRDKRLVTGQNPASAGSAAKAMLEFLESLESSASKESKAGTGTDTGSGMAKAGGKEASGQDVGQPGQARHPMVQGTASPSPGELSY